MARTQTVVVVAGGLVWQIYGVRGVACTHPPPLPPLRRGITARKLKRSFSKILENPTLWFDLNTK